jgi:hypothetical protein
MFRNGTFSITAIAAWSPVMGMFGVLVSLPLYLQIVRGATPTESGPAAAPADAPDHARLRWSPGSCISRTGHYKTFPIMGSAHDRSGLAAAHVGVDTEFWRTSVYMACSGFGLGNVMQPITLAVQNAMPPQDIGRRHVVGDLLPADGRHARLPAVFLSVLFSTVAGKIGDAFRTAATTEAFQAAVNDPAVAADPANQRGTGGAARGGTAQRFGAQRHVVHPAPRPRAGPADPDRVLRVDGPGLPPRGGDPGDRVRVLLFLPQVARCGPSRRLAAREAASPARRRPARPTRDRPADARPTAAGRPGGGGSALPATSPSLTGRGSPGRTATRWRRPC